jgi:hypothetical protein
MANEQNWEQSKENSQEDRSYSKNRGNFKNDPQRAAEAGRKGGQASRGGGRRVSE